MTGTQLGCGAQTPESGMLLFRVHGLAPRKDGEEAGVRLKLANMEPLRSRLRCTSLNALARGSWEAVLPDPSLCRTASWPGVWSHRSHSPHPGLLPSLQD